MLRARRWQNESSEVGWNHPGSIVKDQSEAPQLQLHALTPGGELQLQDRARYLILRFGLPMLLLAGMNPATKAHIWRKEWPIRPVKKY
jgi:hypothetical protein